MWIVKLALRRPYTFTVLALLILILGPIVILRTPTESASADNFRFVPITLVHQEGLLDKAARPDPERAIAEPW